jgi:GT2 family glycosyltransferase
VLLNNDVEVDHRWLNELVRGMDRHPECMMGASKMIQYDHHGQLYNTGDLFKVWCTGGQRGFGKIDEGQYEKEEYVFGACAGAGIYRRELFESVGLFDEDFFIFSEDVDLNLRSQLNGWRALYLPKAIVYHWGTATVGFNSPRHIFLGCRNDLFVLVKNYTLREYVRHSGKILLFGLRSMIDQSLSGKGWCVFKSGLSFLWFLPRMLVKRIHQLSSRKRSLQEIPEIIQ